MQLRPRLLVLACLPLFLAACSGNGGGMGFLDTPTELKDIHYYYNRLFDNYAIAVNINSGGDIMITEQRGPGPSNIRQVGGQLTVEQKASLLAAFKGWKQLKTSYAGDWNVTAEITFDEYKVTAFNSDRLPKTFTKAQSAIDSVARATLPPWPATPPATAPAAAPAVAPATAPASTP